MYLRLLEIEQFRGYRHLNLPLYPGGLRLRGANASGKSSLLEAIVMLATTRSPRSGSDREVIRIGSGTELGVPAFARLRGIVERLDGDVEIEIGLQGDPGRPASAKKSIRVDGRAVRSVDAVGQLKAVLFSPEDVGLVSGGPATRRRYLDLTISQIDRSYLRALSRYLRVLEQRNSLLKSLQRDRVDPRGVLASGQLAFWDEELLLHGTLVVAARLSTVARLAALAREQFHRLAGGDLAVGYVPSIGSAEGFAAGLAAPDAVVSSLRQTFVAALEERRTEEVRRGVTVVGPHRDDLQFTLDGLDLGVFGSRGQQRLAVVALKLAETVAMTDVAGEPPVLLLDDVLSELDRGHRRQLEETATTIRAQTIVTGTDASEWTGSSLARLPGAMLHDGAVTADEPAS